MTGVRYRRADKRAALSIGHEGAGYRAELVTVAFPGIDPPAPTGVALEDGDLRNLLRRAIVTADHLGLERAVEPDELELVAELQLRARRP